MRKTQPAPQTFNLTKTTKKVALYGFVVSTFIAYAVHDRLTASDSSTAQGPGSSSNNTVAKTLPQSSSGDSATGNSQPGPAPVTNSSYGYKDGQYTGDSTDAYYGYVQVEATIQGGKISDVQFLDFPQDRRTSQRINSYAVPVLRNEAIQAQSFQVDIISGATLTSEAFVQSLQSALSRARG